jgi:hypothetical protein
MIQVINNSTFPFIFLLKVYSESKNIPFGLTASIVNSGYVLFYNIYINIYIRKFLDKKMANSSSEWNKRKR